MSEELIQKKLTKSGIKITKYEYFDTTRTSINAFKKYGIVPNNGLENTEEENQMVY